MLRSIWLLVLISTVLAACGTDRPTHVDSSAERPTLVAAPEPGTKYVTILGDGFSNSDGKTGADPVAWPALIVPMLRDRSMTIQTQTYASISTGYVEHDKGGRTFLDLARRLVGKNTNLVVIFGGDRDISALPHGTVLRDRVRSTFQTVKAAGPRAHILVIGPMALGPPSDALLRVRDVIRNQATEAGAVFVDPISEDWLSGQSEVAGGVRLNAEGQRRLAHIIAPLIAGQLRNN